MTLQTKLILHRAHEWHRRSGLPVEDFVQEGTIANLEAELTFDPTKGAKLSTWIWWQIERRMGRFAMQNKRIIYTDEPPELSQDDVQAGRAEFEQMIAHAPYDVRQVCQLILAAPENFAGHTPYWCSKLLLQLLAIELGWDDERAEAAVEQTKRILQGRLRRRPRLQRRAEAA